MIPEREFAANAKEEATDRERLRARLVAFLRLSVYKAERDVRMFRYAAGVSKRKPFAYEERAR